MATLLDLFNEFRVPAQHLASLLLAGAVWRWGGAPERWLIGVFLATMVVPVYIARGLGLSATDIGPWATMVISLDLMAAALFVGIALNANRNYPLWIAGFQVVAVAAHLVKALVHEVSPLAYAILVIGPSYCQLLLLIAGFARHALRQRRFGPYREWRQAVPGVLGWRP